ncbi:MAG: UpxY family transcription antiterminator [Gammaproteobacteria bacterium]|nr:MAG: UpxY family transcription antiterminator [Gammaproteobacteria bacterium]
MTPDPVWYAVYTKPRWEKKVAQLLTKSGIQNYCPLNKVLKQWHDRKKWVEEPLFTSYVFVCLTPAEQAEVRKTAGVLNFVYWLGKPAVIRTDEINAIKDFLTLHKDVRLEKARIQTDDRVQIIYGPLLHKQGTVLEVHQKTVKVLLPALGYAMVAQVDKNHVDIINKATDKATNSHRQPVIAL